MKISVTVDIDDYVFEFYKKVSEYITHCSIPETMSRALFAYAGFVANEMQNADDAGFDTQQIPQ